MKATSSQEDSGFPITNVGNDRRGLLSGMTEGAFVGNDGRGAFSYLSFPWPPSCHSRGPLLSFPRPPPSCHSRSF